jgi:hypothetical protein
MYTELHRSLAWPEQRQTQVSQNLVPREHGSESPVAGHLLVDLRAGKEVDAIRSFRPRSN